MKRAYTLTDLDLMRAAIRRKLDGVIQGCGVEAEFASKTYRDIMVEEQLRTAIMADIAPWEFEDNIRMETQ